MKNLLAVAVMALFLPGCVVAGVGLTAIAADNIAQGDASHTNRALDWTCDRTTGGQRLEDGSCPSR